MAESCAKCAQEIFPSERTYDGKCPDCFRAYVLELLETSPQIVAQALGMEVK